MTVLSDATASREPAASAFTVMEAIGAPAGPVAVAVPDGCVGCDPPHAASAASRPVARNVERIGLPLAFKGNAKTPRSIPPCLTGTRVL